MNVAVDQAGYEKAASPVDLPLATQRMLADFGNFSVEDSYVGMRDRFRALGRYDCHVGNDEARKCLLGSCAGKEQQTGDHRRRGRKQSIHEDFSAAECDLQFRQAGSQSGCIMHLGQSGLARIHCSAASFPALNDDQSGSIR